MKRIGVTTAAKNISSEIIDRFKRFLTDSINSNSELELNIHIPILDSETLHSNGQFSKSKSFNSGIRELISTGSEVILCVDIDVIVPPGLLEYIYHKTLQTQKNIFVVPRYIDLDQFIKIYPNWERFHSIPNEYRALGMCNCMPVELWIESGGWPEELYEWGFEDDLFHEKLKKRNIETVNITSFPLLHINHPIRNPNQALSHLNNVRISRQYDVCSTNWL